MEETDRERLRKKLKELGRLLSELRQNWVFVEGLKDKAALMRLGCERVKTISGNLRKSCQELDDSVSRVIVLTDMDRRGDELLEAARSELESCSKTADVRTRKRLAGILRIRNFEDAERKYEGFMEMINEMETTGDMTWQRRI
jgi:5S rRNA maturation endonuclease (ribonuclease M5)